jgi:iron complex transport system substrate-binding protein
MSTRPRHLVPVALAVALAFVVSGCTGDPGPDESPTPTVTDNRPLAELDLLADPRSAEGPATAVLTSEAVDPVATDPVQNLPATVVSYDASGERTVTVDDTSRVVALDIAGSIAATVWGLGFGDSLVGRDVSTTFPGTEDLPIITSNGHTVDAEAVLALRPTLVIADGSIGPRDVLAQLREAGVAVVFVATDPSFTGAADLARQVAAAFGAEETGELLADRIETEVELKVAEIAAIIPTDPDDRVRMMFLYLRGGSGVYYLFGEESGADELIAGLGGVDVAAEIGWVGMRPMTDEAIVAADPDLILVMTDGIASAGGVAGLLAEKPALALTRAGRYERFVDIADGDVLGFGPRSAAVLDALARAIYATPGS